MLKNRVKLRDFHALGGQQVGPKIQGCTTAPEFSPDLAQMTLDFDATMLETDLTFTSLNIFASQLRIS